MGGLLRFGVSIEQRLLTNFDRLTARRGYATRSEALRDLIRDSIIQARLEESQQNIDVVGGLTIVFDPGVVDIAKRMAEIQHSRGNSIISALHVHFSQNECMEILVVRGLGSEIQLMSDALLSLKGVKHGKLFVTPSSESMARETGPWPPKNPQLIP